MTSETSENTIFVRFYLLCYLMLTNTKSQNKYYLGEITKSSIIIIIIIIIINFIYRG